MANSTRVCVKNLAPNVTETTLQSYLSNKRDVKITDCFILKTKDGVKRRMAFVGFQTSEMASSCVKHFNNTFMGTVKMRVEIALPKGDADSARPWSRHSAGSSRYEEKNSGGTSRKRKKGDDGEESSTSASACAPDSASDPDKDKKKRKEEFLNAMQSRNHTSFWANDDFDAKGAAAAAASSSQPQPQPQPQPDDSGDSSSDVASSDSDSDSDSNSDSDSESKSKSKSNSKPKSKSKSNSTPNPTPNPTPSSSSRIFVRNLPFNTTEQSLKQHFQSVGEVTLAHIPIDDLKKQKGFGFVTFASPSSVPTAIATLDNKSFQGRIIRVHNAKQSEEENSKESKDDENDKSSLTYKKKKEIERKEKADQAYGWNASYIRSDAVVDSLASRLNVEKGAILDHTQGNMAVRLALGETEIIQENRDFLQAHGIDLDVMETKKTSRKGNSSNRSVTMLLVKNLPFNTSEDDIRNLFVNFGELKKLKLPPSRTLALVEFTQPTEARKAFKNLAYSKFQHVPLYLEWAPISPTFVPPPSTALNTTPKPSPLDEEEERAVHSNFQSKTSIFVKNLNFKTTTEGLSRFFGTFSNVRSATIPKNKENQHMGFGFVEFSDEKSMIAALKQAQGKMLDNFPLLLEASSGESSTSTSSSKSSKSKNKKNTKIMVKNVPFQANRDELLELFNQFGTVKKCKMPKKFDGSHRGFAFVDFASAKEAEVVMAKMSKTHLYGRHLVLNWEAGEE